VEQLSRDDKEEKNYIQWHRETQCRLNSRIYGRCPPRLNRDSPDTVVSSFVRGGNLTKTAAVIVEYLQSHSALPI
jgi:hypothetical protein